jgi:hypothetical protein
MSLPGQEAFRLTEQVLSLLRAKAGARVYSELPCCA